MNSESKNELQKSIDQIGLGTVLSMLPAQANVLNCTIHGSYMGDKEDATCSCPLCKIKEVPSGDGNGTPYAKIKADKVMRDSGIVYISL